MYLLAIEGRVFVVDPGPSFQLNPVARELRASGRSPYEVTGILLTHSVTVTTATRRRSGGAGPAPRCGWVTLTPRSCGPARFPARGCVGSRAGVSAVGASRERTQHRRHHLQVEPLGAPTLGPPIHRSVFGPVPNLAYPMPFGKVPVTGLRIPALLRRRRTATAAPAAPTARTAVVTTARSHTRASSSHDAASSACLALDGRLHAGEPGIEVVLGQLHRHRVERRLSPVRRNVFLGEG